MKASVKLAWLLSAFCVVGSSARLIGWLLAHKGPATLDDFGQAIGWSWAVPVLFSVVAALIIGRQPLNRVGWLLMLPALVTAATPEYSLATPQPRLTLGLWLLLWFSGWSWIPIIFSVFLIPLHFPSGRPLSPRWKWVNWLAGGMWLFFVTMVTFFDEIGPLNYDWKLPNPIGFIPIEAGDGPLLIVWGMGLITVVSASVFSLFRRYRRAEVVERQQIKWLLYVGAIFVVIYSAIYFISDSGKFGMIAAWTDVILVLSVLAFPVAIAISILRYRLFDIDVIIRKTLVYTLLSALLALVYLGLVLLLQSAFDAASGQQSPIAIVLSTLVIAALFAPLRRRIQDFIDRRFFREKYDGQQVLAQFAQTARDEVSLEALTAELSRVVEKTMAPQTISLWLKPTAVPGKQPRR